MRKRLACPTFSQKTYEGKETNDGSIDRMNTVGEPFGMQINH